MNAITIFVGAQDTGKTATAERISKSKKTIWINSFDRDTFFELSENTELIIIDEVEFHHGLKMIKWFIENETIRFRKPYTDRIKVIPRPEIIVCTNSEKEEIPTDILQKVTLREFFNHS